MEAASRRNVKHLRLRLPMISHAAAVLILGLAFYSEDLDGVVDAIDVFMFPDMFPSVGLDPPYWKGGRMKYWWAVPSHPFPEPVYYCPIIGWSHSRYGNPWISSWSH